jgi:hypothetical protein
MNSRRPSLLISLRNAVEYCQQDALGSSGRTVQYDRFFIRKLSSIEFEAVSDWGITYFMNQHGVLVGQIGNETESEHEFGQLTLQILRIIQAASSPIEARNAVVTAVQKPRKRIAQKLYDMEKKGLLEKVPFESEVVSAPVVHGYKIAWRGKEILRMNDEFGERISNS